MKYRNLILLIGIFFGVTFIVGWIITNKTSILGGSTDGWLGYYGGIIGSILGVLGAYFIMKEQISEEKHKYEMQNIENERPYFFIEEMDNKNLEFYFYNKNNSILKEVNLIVKENTQEYIKFPLGHCKSDKICHFTDENGILDEESVIFSGKTLYEEVFVFIYSNLLSEKICNDCAFIYDPMKKKKMYTYLGEIKPEIFEQVINIIENAEYIYYPELSRKISKS